MRLGVDLANVSILLLCAVALSFALVMRSPVFPIVSNAVSALGYLSCK